MLPLRSPANTPSSTDLQTLALLNRCLGHIVGNAEVILAFRLVFLNRFLGSYQRRVGVLDAMPSGEYCILRFARQPVREVVFQTLATSGLPKDGQLT